MFKQLATVAVTLTCFAGAPASAQTPDIWAYVTQPNDVQILDRSDDGYRVYQPVGDVVDAPLVAYLHGGTTVPAWADPASQEQLQLLARLGYNVVEMTYCDWDIYCADVPAWKERSVDTLQAAVAFLETTDVPARLDDGELEWSILAYSMGTVVAPHMAMLAAERGLSDPRVIVTQEAAGVVLNEGWFKYVYGAEHGFPKNWDNWLIFGGHQPSKNEANAAVAEVADYWDDHGWDGELNVASHLPIEGDALAGLSADIELVSIVGEEGLWSIPGVPFFGIDPDMTAAGTWAGTDHLLVRSAMLVPSFSEGDVDYVSDHVAPLTHGGFATDLLDRHGYWVNTVGCLERAHGGAYPMLCGVTYVTSDVALTTPSFAE